MNLSTWQISLAIIVIIWIGRIVWRLVTGNAGARWFVAEGQPDVREAVAAVARQDWATVERLYHDRPIADRYHFLHGLGALTKLDAPLPQNPTGALATITAGVCLKWAWRHRGGLMGAQVTERGGMNMMRLLEQAERLIQSQGEGIDSVACAIAIRVAMGLDGNRGPLQRALNRAASTGERNIFVPLNHLMFIAPKWHGSAEELMEEAQKYAATDHPAWIALLAVAHNESWLYQDIASERAGARPEAASRYLGPAFREEIEALDDRFWRLVNVGASAMTHAESVIAHNAFAYLLLKIGSNGRLGRHMDRLGKDISEQPWAYQGYPQSPEAVNAIRAQAGLPPL